MTDDLRARLTALVAAVHRRIEAMTALGPTQGRAEYVAGLREAADEVAALLREPPARCCGQMAPDRLGRTCDLPEGHAGDHWTDGGNTKWWSRDTKRWSRDDDHPTHTGAGRVPRAAS
jgi:hypothetical protein